MAEKTTGNLKLWLTKITDKISDTINTYLPENFTKIDTEFSSLKDDVESHLAESASHVKPARIVIGTSTSGWTEKDCDYLCDGIEDDVEINAAITALPATGGEIVILDGTYNITAKINVAKDNVSIKGNGSATVLKRVWNSSSEEGVITLSGVNGCEIEKLAINGDRINYLSGNNYGIFLSNNSGNIIKSCTIYESLAAIVLNLCSGNVISLNNLNDNVTGITLANSNRNIIKANTCNDSSVGITLFNDSSKNIVSGNICIRGTGTPEDYDLGDTIWLAGTDNSYNLVVNNHCAGKAPTIDGGIGNTVFNNKWDESSDFEDLKAEVIAHKAETATQIALIKDKIGIAPFVKSWEEVQAIVRAGLAEEYFEIGDQFLSMYDGKVIVWTIIGIDHDTPTDTEYSHSLTIQTRDCLDNVQFDAPEPTNPDENRQEYGNNRYLHSAIKQWLNSNEDTFQWVSQHQYDAPPSGSIYEGPGFLKLLDPDLAAVIGAVNKQVARNTATDGGGQDLFSDKVFLLSRVEAGLGTEGVTDGEVVYPYYDGISDAGRIKLLNGSPRIWWLRSPYVSTSHSVRGVHTDGTVNNNAARSAYGLAPACCII